MTDPSDVPPADTGASAVAVASPAGEAAGRALDDLAREMERTFDGAVKGGIPLDKVPLPMRRLPEGAIVGVLFPPEATPDYLICALGPCIHYSTQVVHLETKNQEVTGDGIAHAERTHWCDHFKRDLDDRIFDCSRWEPAVSVGGISAAECPGSGGKGEGCGQDSPRWRCPACGVDDFACAPPDRLLPHHNLTTGALKAAHLAKIRFKPEIVEGYVKCSVEECGKLRERSGVIDWKARCEYACQEAIRLEMAETDAKTTIGISRKMRANMRMPPSAFCICGEDPKTVPKEWA